MAEPSTPANTVSEEPVWFIFLSYCWADNEQPGRDWCDWLKEELEAFRIPDLFERTATALDKKLRGNLRPIHQDRDQFRLGQDLPTVMERHLEESRWLIVLWSPRAMASPAVQREIGFFQAREKADRIIYVVIDWPSARPEIPKQNPDKDPLYADLRVGPEKVQGYCRPRDRSGNFLKGAILDLEAVDPEWLAYNAVLKERILEIAAAVLEVGPDAIKRHVAQEHKLAQDQADMRILRAKAKRVGTTALGVILALVVGFGLWLSWLRHENARLLAEISQKRLEKNQLIQDREKLAREIEEEKWRFSRADHVRAEQLFRAGDWDLGIAYLARAARTQPANFTARAYLWSAIAMTPGASDTLAAETLPFPSAADLEVTDDGNTILVRSEDEGTTIWYRQGSEWLRLARSFRKEASFVSMRPDGRSLLVAYTDGEVALEGFNSSASIKSLKQRLQGVTGAKWLGTQDRLVLLAQERFQTFDFETGQPIGKPIAPGWTIRGDPFRTAFIVPKFTDWSVNSRHNIAVALNEIGDLFIWRPDTGELLLSRQARPGNQALAFAFSPGGRSVAISERNGISSFEVAENKAIPMAQANLSFPFFSFQARSLAFGANGDFLYAAGAAGDFRTLSKGALREPYYVRGLSPDATPVCFSPDSRWLATVSNRGRVDLWRVYPDCIRPWIRFHISGNPQIIFSASSNRVIVRAANGAAYTWTLPDESLSGIVVEEGPDKNSDPISKNKRWKIAGNSEVQSRIINAQTGETASMPIESLRSKNVLNFFPYSAKWDSEMRHVLITGKPDKSALFPFGAPETVPAFLPDLIRATVGLSGTAQMEFEPIDIKMQLEARDKLKALRTGETAGSVQDRDWTRLLSWLLGPLANRINSP